MATTVVDSSTDASGTIERILVRRAQRLGTSREELELITDLRDLVPSAAELAEKIGISVEAVLESDARRMLASTYPGPDCLSADEMQSLAHDGNSLSSERRLHVLECSMCSDVLELVGKPPTSTFLERIRNANAEAVSDSTT